MNTPQELPWYRAVLSFQYAGIHSQRSLYLRAHSAEDAVTCIRVTHGTDLDPRTSPHLTQLSCIRADEVPAYTRALLGIENTGCGWGPPNETP